MLKDRSLDSEGDFDDYLNSGENKVLTKKIMKQTSASHASQTSLSSTNKREPYLLTFNENGPFSKQNALFDLKNNSHLMNST